MFKSKVKLLRLVKITAGRKHAWYEAEIKGETILVRKPYIPTQESHSEKAE